MKVNGKKYQSNGVKIEVLSAGQQPSTQNNNNAGTVSSEELFVRTIVTKTKVREQEAFAITYRLYLRGIEGVQLTNNPRFPEFQGFLKQELEQNNNQQAKLEEYNGNPYQVVDLYRCVLS